MVNEEILTALKNALDHGESLESAVSSMVGSGYNPNEVHEAANLVGYGTMNYLQPRHEESLAMPSQKNIFGFPIKKQAQPQQKTPQPAQQVPQSQMQQQSQQPMQQQPYQQPPQQFQTIQNQRSSIQQNPGAIKQNINSGAIISSNKQQVPIQYQRPQYPQNPQTPQPIPVFQPGFQNPTQPLQVIPPKKTYTKEIILILILLTLVGILITTILFKGKILGFIQGLGS